MSRAISPSFALVLVLAGAVVGALTAATVSTALEPGSTASHTADPATSTELLERIERLEAELVEARRSRRPRPGSPAADETAAATQEGGPTGSDSSRRDRADTGRDAIDDAPSTPDGSRAATNVDDAFVARVGEAIRTLQERAAGEREAQKRKQEREKALRELGRKLREYVPRLGLDEATANAFVEATTAGTTRLLDAQAAGVGGEELATLTRENQQRYQDLLGEAGYRELRKLELDAAARPSIVSIAGQAGVDGPQREQIERLLTDHIESLVDLDVRARTQELSPEERQSIRERMNDANREAWDRLRRDILTEEQRDRVPRRLR